MSRKKPAPGLTGGGHRFSDKDMRHSIESGAMLQNGAAAQREHRQSPVAVLVYCVDPALCGRLQQMLRASPLVAVVDAVADAKAVRRRLEQDGVDVVLADGPSYRQLSEWSGGHDQIALVVLSDDAGEEDGLAMLAAGARAILPGSA